MRWRSHQKWLTPSASIVGRRCTNRVGSGYWSVFDDAYRVFVGIHRVQRVPVTEKKGRRHTSEIVVAILPTGVIRSPILGVDPKDIRVDTYRDTGPGGQHRNKTDSAVRITHLPTGIVVSAVEDRSQHKNRAVAHQRLYDALRERDALNAHQKANNARADAFQRGEGWIWTDWRDEVRSPSGKRASYRNALRGNLDKLL